MERIDPRDLLVQIVGVLDQLRIPYLITGGIAVLVWGRPRFTADIDIVVELKEKDIEGLEKNLQKLSSEGYIDKTLMQKALKTRSEFNFIDGVTGIKVDFWILHDDPFDRSRLGRRVAKEIHNKKIYFTSPEDLILIKLKWYKESQSTRQLEDVESILKISGERLNIKYLMEWAEKLGVSDMLNKLK